MLTVDSGFSLASSSAFLAVEPGDGPTAFISGTHKMNFSLPKTLTLRFQKPILAPLVRQSFSPKIRRALV